ncbi:MAG: spermidine/putrescine ABC transporter substrate-binding protein [Solirubrobacterales bacterium]|nr:spermidine/putrescine ABC transporter substrate-binding protein [Solirubrobacterales bacterium]
MSVMKKSRLLVLAVLALAASMVLVACGGDGGGGLSGSDNSDVTTATGGDPQGNLKISNWPLYIDNATIKEFDQAAGTSTTYTDDVNSNTDFFGKMQPLLSNGDSGGRDIIVVTDWMAEKMWKLGYVQKLDKSKIPNVEKNLIPSLQNPAFDPNREYSVPWQSGMTGLVVRTDLAPDIKSINDLFDPKYKGKVTLLDEMRDTIPLMMAADGINPEEATDEQWMDTIAKMKENVGNGQVRKVTGNDYIQDLENGNVVAAIGWSGDTTQTSNPNIKYVQPEQGCSIWSDNMMIPVGAPNPAAAYKFMNYVYDPENQAQITEYVNYVSPVAGVKEVLAKKDPALANDNLIFPSEEFTKNCFAQVSPPGDEQQVQEVEQAFENAKIG